MLLMITEMVSDAESADETFISLLMEMSMFVKSFIATFCE